MEVGRQITLWFIACCCANIIYTQDLADNASTTPPSEESSNLLKLETGNLNGKITALKNGTKVKLTLAGNVFWKNDKSIDNVTCAVPNMKGEKGERGFNGISGLQGTKGEKGDRGNDGNPGVEGRRGEMGEKGDRGANGNQGAEGKMGEQGVKGDIGNKGERGEMGHNGTSGAIGPKGEKGECKLENENLNEREAKGYGDKNSPAYSCSNFQEGKIFLNKPNAFQVECKQNMAYVKDLPKNFNLTGLNKNVEFELSSKIKLKTLYQLLIPQISYLMSTNKEFRLTLTYSDEVEVLGILSWNGIKNEISKLIVNKLSKGQQGCSASQEKNLNAEGKTDLEITCSPAYYLPMEFYMKAQKENISIVLKELRFK